MQSVEAFSLAELDRRKGGSPPTIALTVVDEQRGASDDACRQETSSKRAGTARPEKMVRLKLC